MKKGVKISLFILLMLFSIDVVKADTSCNAKFTATDDYLKAGNSNNSFIYQLHKDNSGKAYTAYCMNPGWSFGKKAGNTNYNCERVLLDPASNDTNLKRYDTGIIYIYSNGNEATANDAFRIYQAFWKLYNTNAYNESPEYRESYQQTAAKLLNNEKVKSALDALRKKVPNGFILDTAVSGDANVSADVINLLVGGINAATNYDPEHEIALTWNDRANISRELVEENASGVKTYKQSEMHVFEFKEFTKDKGELKLDFNCPSCAAKGVSYKFYVTNGNENIEITDLKNTNLFSMAKLNEVGDNRVSGSLIFKIEFTGKSSGCEEIPYTINVRYSDPSFNKKDVYQVSANSYTQSLYVVVDDNSNNNSNNKVKTSVINSTLSFCVNPNESGNNCTTNLTKLNCNQCESKDNTLSIIEGYDSNGACNEPTNLNIPSCIAQDGTHDNAGNSYESEVLKDDLYCGLYCKEDYNIQLPGTQIVNSGRYFTLSASIKGTKTCYANGKDGNGININKFLSDVSSAACSSVNAYNSYAEANSKAEGTIGNVVYSTGNDWCEAPTSGYCMKGHEIKEYDFTTKKYKVTGCTKGYWVSGTSGKRKITGVEVKTKPYYTFSCNGGRIYHASQTIVVPASGCQGSGEAAAIANAKKTLNIERGEPAVVNGGGGCNKNGCLGSVVISPGTGAAGKLGTYGIFGYQFNLNSCSNIETKALDNSIYYVDWPGYNFDPEIDFWYQENAYMSIAKIKNLAMVDYENYDNKYDMYYCTGDVSKDYETCSTGWKTSAPMTSTSVFTCSGTTEDTCRYISVDYSAARYVKKVMKQEAKYLTPTQFYTIYPSGQVVVKNDENNNIENSSPIENGLPIGLGTKSGSYSYVLMFSKLGEYYDTNKLGRIWGDQNSVVSSTLKAENECRKNSSLKYSEQIDNTVFDGGVYSCEYDVNICNENQCQTPDKSEDGKYHCKDGEVCDKDEYLKECDPCPDCPIICEPDGCYKEDPSCPDNKCPVYCPTCVYNNGSNVDYRPVTPEDLNPNDRDLGANWSYDEKINTALELKAYKTTEEIEAAGSKIYDTDSDTGVKVKFNINSAMINDIRKYNDEHKDEGYYNNSLECYDYTDADGVIYRNIYCYSTFIDSLVEKYGDRIEITGNRIMGDRATRKANTQSSGYWTTWAENRDAAKNWNVTTQFEMDTYFKNYKNLGIGPSWK